MNIRPSTDQIKQPERPKLADVMGPGLITGASDDDPSGIATYSQAGAQFGYSRVAFARHLSLGSAFISQPMTRLLKSKRAISRWRSRKPNGSASPRAKTRRHSCC